MKAVRQRKKKKRKKLLEAVPPVAVLTKSECNFNGKSKHHSVDWLACTVWFVTSCVWRRWACDTAAFQRQLGQSDITLCCGKLQKKKVRGEGEREMEGNSGRLPGRLCSLSTSGARRKKSEQPSAKSHSPLWWKVLLPATSVTRSDPAQTRPLTLWLSSFYLQSPVLRPVCALTQKCPVQPPWRFYGQC